MDAMQKRHQVAQPFAQIAPAALAQNGALVRIDKYLVQLRSCGAVLVQPHRKRHAASGLPAKRRGGHYCRRHKAGHALAQRQGVKPRGAVRWRRHAVQRGCCRGVQRVIPRERNASQRDQAEKAGQHQAGPAMQA